MEVIDETKFAFCANKSTIITLTWTGVNKKNRRLFRLIGTQRVTEKPQRFAEIFANLSSFLGESLYSLCETPCT